MSFLIPNEPADYAYTTAVAFGITTKILTNSWALGGLLFALGFITGVYMGWKIQRRAKKRGKG